MKSADLDRIEEALGGKLPQDYRSIMLEYPFPPASIGADMLMDDPDVLLRWNAVEKKRSVQIPDDPSVDRDLFQIGSDGGELRFYIRLTDSANAVVCLDLESGNLTDYSRNITEFVERCIRIDATAEDLPNEHHEIPEPVKWLVGLGLLALLILFGYGVVKSIGWLLSMI